MSRQTSIQISDSMQRQITRLQAAGFGTFTDIVRLAVDRMYQQEIGVPENVFAAWNAMNADIPLEKFGAVVSGVQEHVNASPAKIADFIDGGEEGWQDDPMGHQEWITSTSADEIADWAIAGLR